MNATKFAGFAALAAIAGNMVRNQFTDAGDSDTEKAIWLAVGTAVAAYALYKLA
jgi:hypothetical protein